MPRINTKNKKRGFTRTLTLVWLKVFLWSLCGVVISQIKNYFLQIKSIRNKNTRPKLVCGFTLIELIVTISIATILLAITLFDYGTFNDRVALSSAGQKMAIAIRQAQTYGLSVKEVKVSGGNFSSAYGLYFNPTDNSGDYYIFSDSNTIDRKYTVGNGCGGAVTECVEKITLRNGVKISNIYSTSVGIPACARALAITFLRPNPDADINFINNGGDICSSSQSIGKIVLTSPKNITLTITVENTGQISVQ